MTHKPIPPDFPVQPLKRGEKARNPLDTCTCMECGLSWDDGQVTAYTPVPSARCPFEYFHIYEDEEEPELEDDGDPMKLTDKSYTSVSEMLWDMDPGFAEEFDKRQQARRLINHLVVERGVRGLTEQDVARLMGYTERKINLLEAQPDGHITLEDLIRYAGALGITLSVVTSDGQKFDY